jgi:hypothetical protein
LSWTSRNRFESRRKKCDDAIIVTFAVPNEKLRPPRIGSTRPKRPIIDILRPISRFRRSNDKGSLMTDGTQEGSGLHIDSDWKSQAQAEKDRLTQAEVEKKATGAGEKGAPGEMPPPTWETLVGMMATQAFMYLGGYVDPRTNRPMVDLEAARHQIDLLGVIEEKTKGNLTDDEAKQLAGVIYELRMQYVRIAQAAMAQAQGGGQAPTPDDPAGQIHT